LTANLQLRPVPQPSRDTPKGRPRARPEPGPRPFMRGVERGPGEAPIDGSSTLHLPAAVFSTARRACDPTSGVPFHDPRRIRHRCRIPFASSRWTRLCRRLVKDDDVRRARTPSIDECSLPRARRTLACLRMGSRGARHRCRCSRARGFRHRNPASGALSPAEPGPRTRREPEARGLDPRSRDRDQAPLVDFCNQPNPRARPLDRPIPVSCAKSRASVRSRAPLASLSGIGLSAIFAPRGRSRSPSAASPPKDGPTSAAEASPTDAVPAPSTGSTVNPRGARPKPRPTSIDGHQPRFHGPGAVCIRSRIRR